MGGFLSLGFADVIGIYQCWHYGSRDNTWNKIEYDNNLIGFRVDLLNTIREEIRDQVAVIISSLDNVMLVATLMFSLSFAFSTEGNYPPFHDDDSGWEKSMRAVYSVLAAISLICPFWALIFTIRMRYEVDTILSNHMEDLQLQLCRILERQPVLRPGEQQGLQGSLPDRPTSSLRQRRGPGELWDTLRGSLGGRAVYKEIPMFHDINEIVTWAKEDMPDKLKRYHFYYPLVQLLLWFGMLSAVCACAVLTCLHWQEQYPNEPWLWVVYGSIVGLNCVLSALFVGWMLCAGSATSHGVMARVQGKQKAASPPAFPADHAGYGSTAQGSAPLPQRQDLERGSPSDVDFLDAIEHSDDQTPLAPVEADVPMWRGSPRAELAQ